MKPIITNIEETLANLKARENQMPRLPLHLPANRRDWTMEQIAQAIELRGCALVYRRGQGFRVPKKEPRTDADGKTRGDRKRIARAFHIERVKLQQAEARHAAALGA